MVKVISLDAPKPATEQRLGFLAGRADVPEDFNSMGATEIGRAFGHEVDKR